MRLGIIIGVTYGFLTMFFVLVGLSGLIIPWYITVILAGAISATGFLDAYDCWRRKKK